MQRIRLGVVYGGPSVEHEISIISAVQAMAAINTDKYCIIPIFITKDGQWYTGEALLDIANYSDLKNLLSTCTKVSITATRGRHYLLVPAKGIFGKPSQIDIDVILPVMHGAHGEDGGMQGLLELLNIPYAGPSVLGAAVGMDKIMMKAILQQCNLPVVSYQWFTSTAWFESKEEIIAKLERTLAYPVIVKPANLGSSVGISRADERDGLVQALDHAATFSNRLLVERCVENMREINCSVIGGNGQAEASVCEEPITQNNILTYQDKYMGGSKGANGTKGAKGTKGAGGSKSANRGGMSGSSREIPAKISPEKSTEIQVLAKEAFIALDGNGVSRIDMIIDKDLDKVYINEINTIPGSLSFYLWDASGMDFTALVDKLVDLALQRQRCKDKLVLSYDTNILEGFKNN